MVREMKYNMTSITNQNVFLIIYDIFRIIWLYYSVAIFYNLFVYYFWAL